MIKMIKVIKKNSTHNSAIHPRPKEVVVFLHYKDKIPNIKYYKNTNLIWYSLIS